MASGLRRFAQDVSPYLLLLIAITTLGPLQFGFHLVSCSPSALPGLPLRRLEADGH